MFTLQAVDGCRLEGRIDGMATSEAPTARALVLIVHGLGEHAGRYDALTRHLVGRGLAVARYDQRGHGRSGGPRAALAQLDSLCADLGQVIDHLRGPPKAATLPLVLLGHSMGGLVAARFVADALATRPAAWSKPVQRLVLSSPALDVGMNFAQRALVSLLAPLVPDLALGNGLRPAWISRNPEVVRAYQADPLVHDRITPRLARFFQEAGTTVRHAAARWAVPTLLQYAGADRCVRPAGSAAFAATAPGRILTCHRYADLAHEIYNEPERDQVWADLDRWLDQALH